jgi:GntR family transcriptional regulator
MSGLEFAMLNRYSDRPLYRQLTELLVARLDHELRPGDRLPSETELAAEYDVNRLTVRQAIAELARQGLVDAVQGKGTFVAAPAIRYEVAAGRHASFTRAMQSQGHGVEVRLLRATPDEDPGIRRELQTRRRVHRYNLLRVVNGVPWSLTATWLPVSRFPGLHRYWSGDASLFDALEQHYGVRMVRRARSFAAVPADAVDAEHLMLPVGAPVLIARGMNVSEDGEPISLVEHRCRGDRVQFCVEFE